MYITRTDSNLIYCSVPITNILSNSLYNCGKGEIGLEFGKVSFSTVFFNICITLAILIIDG